MAETWLPRARRERLAVTEVGGEVVVYDLDADRAHCLNPSALAIWQSCDGSRTVAEVATVIDAPNEEAVWHGLHQLASEGLLDSALPATAPDRSVSRREMLRKIAIGGAVGLAVPTVISIVAPQAAAAVSKSGNCQACNGNGQCASNNCTASNVCAPAGQILALPAGSPCTLGNQCCSGVCSGGTCAP
ncbi:MAG: PqqD family peptide modification chaperone [Acidimicrobiales bacterium]